MDGNLSLILAFLVSISVVLALVIKFKLHPFLSLFIGCLLMGVCSGLDPMAIIKTSCKGFGDTMGDIGIIILLGVAMGQILHESGCTREIANTMLRLCGREKSALALNLTGYIISIPVFFDAAFVILIGLIREMAREGKLALNTLVTALVVGLTCTHALVIPTPGPVAVAGNMGADIGWFIVYGVLIALPASLIGGVLYGKFLGRKSPIFLTDEEPDAALVEQALAKSDHPSGALGIAIIFLPIMLIFFANILNAFLDPASSASRVVSFFLNAFLDPASSASRVVSFFGNTNIVLLITVFVAYFSLREHLPEPFDTVVSRGAESVGSILAIIGAGGAFGAVIGASGISTAIVDVMQSWSIPVILLGFLMSQCLRIGLGSITVSIVTASAVLAPVASQLGASPVLVGLAICCGGIGLGLPNDSGFWTICKMSGLSTKQAFLVYPIPTLISGLVGLAVLLILNMFASSLPGLM